jgi:general L-amino acid transport system permease protein
MSDTHAQSVAYVRETTIPPAPPPARETGIVKWLRENLFATIPNSLLTLLALYAIYLILSPTVPWILNGVWNASSLSECREILDGTRGACFAVLTERWPQLLFGVYYPSEAYWRPILAFLLLIVAGAPVLFFNLPRQLLIVTALFPFVAYWLIWGGTILVPVLALLGFVAGGLVFRRLSRNSFASGFFGAVIAACAVWVVGGFLIPDSASENALLTPVPSRDLGGFMLNMMLGVTCVSLSVPLGIAACRSSNGSA